jgi:hypothetical protein
VKADGERLWRAFEPDDERFWEGIKAEERLWAGMRVSGVRQFEAYRDQEKRIRARLVAYLQLSSEEVQALERIERKFDMPLEVLLRRWTGLVIEAEAGYKEVREEWSNDLSSRQVLDEVLEAASGLRPKLERVVRPWDERFRRVTVATAWPAGGFIHDGGRLLARDDVPWWWFRYPPTLLVNLPELAHGSPDFWDDAGRPIPTAARRIEKSWHELQLRVGTAR